MKTRKLASLLLAALLCVMFLSACGGGGETPSAAETPQQSTAADSQPAAEEPPAETGGNTLYYWAMWNENEPQAEVIKAVIADFEERNPGVKVEISWQGRDIRTIIKTALDSDEKIDVFEQSPDWLYPNLGTSYLLNLDEYVAQVYDTTDGKTFEETLVPSIVELARSYNKSEGDNAFYYVPHQPNINVVFYNKDHFDDAGITESPKTWDEFMEVCEKLKAAGHAPMTVDDAYLDMLYGNYLGLLKGEDWVTELVTDTTGEMWGDPAVKQMAEAYQFMRDNGYFSSSTGSNVYPAGQQEVALGTTTMYLNGSWLTTEVADTAGPDFRWGCFRLPDPKGAENPGAVGFVSQGYCVPAKSQNPDLAFELIRLFMAPDYQQMLVDKAKVLPAVNGVGFPGGLEEVKDIFESVEKTMPWVGNAGAAGDFGSSISGAFAELLIGDISADEFVTRMQTEAVR